MKQYIFVSTLLLPLSAVAAEEAGLLERIEQLEHRVEMLERHHGGALEQSRTVSTSVEFSDTGYASVSYWLGRQSAFSSEAVEPMAKGRLKLTDTFVLRPDAYGVQAGEQGIFSPFFEPSLYPVASLSVDAHLMAPSSGKYWLHIKPTPPREVGGSGDVAMAIRISVNGHQVFSQDYSSTLTSSRVAVQLDETPTPFRMEVVARSPGFGPSPTRAKIYIGLQGKNGVGTEPIARFLTFAQ